MGLTNKEYHDCVTTANQNKAKHTSKVQNKNKSKKCKEKLLNAEQLKI